MKAMSTRLATAHDHHDAIRWLRADQTAPGVRVVVEEVDGRLAGAALRAPNPVHPGLDFLEVAMVGPATPALLHGILALAPEPVLMRGLPGSDEHSLAVASGARVFERVPASRIDPTDPEVVAWAARHAGDARPATGYGIEELTAVWIEFYLASHQHFGVTTDRDVLERRLGGFVRRAVDRELSRVVERDGQVVAFAFTFAEGPHRMAIVDAVDPLQSGARRAVEVAMAALLQALPPEPIELDGHESGRHHPAVLATIPNVTAGPLTPMELLRLAP